VCPGGREANPCLDVRLEVEKRTHDPWTFLTHEEQDAIIAATPKPLDAIVEFAIGTGLRSGEMVILPHGMDHTSHAADTQYSRTSPRNDSPHKAPRTKVLAKARLDELPESLNDLVPPSG